MKYFIHFCFDQHYLHETAPEVSKASLIIDFVSKPERKKRPTKLISAEIYSKIAIDVRLFLLSRQSVLISTCSAEEQPKLQLR